MYCEKSESIKHETETLFRLSILTGCPKIQYDKFHVMKMMNEAVDEVRKQEQSTIKEQKVGRLH
jgi:transposase